MNQIFVLHPEFGKVQLSTRDSILTWSISLTPVGIEALEAQYQSTIFDLFMSRSRIHVEFDLRGKRVRGFAFTSNDTLVGSSKPEEV